MGITPTTPLRTGRAAFPHPAPYKANTSRVSAIDVDINLRFGQGKVLQDITESVPSIALLLTPSIQPVE